MDETRRSRSCDLGLVRSGQVRPGSDQNRDFRDGFDFPLPLAWLFILESADGLTVKTLCFQLCMESANSSHATSLHIGSIIDSI